MNPPPPSSMHYCHHPPACHMCLLTLSNTTLKSDADLVFKPQVWMSIPFLFILSIRCIVTFCLYNNNVILTVHTVSELAISFQGPSKCDIRHTNVHHLCFLCCYTLHGKYGNKLDS